MVKQTKRKRNDVLWSQLDSEFNSFKPQLRDLGDYILPSRQRWTITDANKGDRRNLKIIDSTATLAADTLSAGMMSGVTSPARPWFRLTTPDPGLAEVGRVKEWLHVVTQRMATSFFRSNLYNILPTQYCDLGVFGTAPILVEEDFKNVLYATSFPVGSYRIAKDSRGRVNVFFREFRMTVRQVVEQFGRRDERTGKPDWSIFSDWIKQQYNEGNYETWVDIRHVIQPNEEYDQKRVGSKFKKFSSCYYERGIGPAGGSYLRSWDEDRYLRESGYDHFPVLCPRWKVSGEDVYATSCPGMVSIGDIKQLQHGEKMISEAIVKTIRPPMVGPPSLKKTKASILPGDITYENVREGQRGFRPAFELRFPIAEAEAKQAQIRERIDEAFFKKLFLALSMDRRAARATAREIDEIHEEKLLALGPVLEQLNQDQLKPLIDITFAIHVRQGLIPPPPEELQGMELKIEFISIMAQAQKMIGIAGLDRFLGTVSQIAAVKPGALDKIDEDQIIDIYADLLSAPPGAVKSDEKVAEERKAQAQAVQAERQAQMIQAGAGVAKDLSQADMEGDNALTRILEGSGAAGGVMSQ